MTLTSVIWAVGIRERFTEEVGFKLAPVMIRLRIEDGLKVPFFY